MMDERRFLLQELKEIEEDLQRVRKILDELEREHGIKSEEFSKKFEDHEIEPERDFISWHAHYIAYIGLIKRRDEIIQRLSELSGKG